MLAAVPDASVSPARGAIGDPGRVTRGAAILLAVLISLPGCAIVQSDKSTTPSHAAAGAVTGAVVGGGLGTVVGVAAGNPGGGLVLGSLAGAAVGSAVGSTMDTESKQVVQNKQILEDKQILSERQEQIDLQQREVDQLRQELQDAIPPANKPSVAPPEFSSTNYQGNPRAKPYVVTLNESARTRIALPVGATSDPRNTGARRAPTLGSPALHQNHSDESVTAQDPAASSDEDPILMDQRAYITADADKEAQQLAVADHRQPAPAGQTDGVSERLPKPQLGHGEISSEKHGGIVKKASSARVSENPPAFGSVSEDLPGGDLPGGVTKVSSDGVSENPPASENPAVAGSVSENLPSGSAATKHSRGSRTGAPLPRVAKANGGSCELAGAEAERARKSGSDADRLFYLRRALRLCPSNAGYHVEVGQIYAGLGRAEDAQFEFRQAIDLDPDNRVALHELDNILQRDGKL